MIDVYAIISAKKIYSIEPEKVVNNKIDSVSVNLSALTKSEITPTDYTLSSPSVTTNATITSDYRDFGTSREGDKGKARDKIYVTFAKSTIPFSSSQLVDFSKLDLLFKFSTSTTGDLTHTAISSYSTYAKNSEPTEKLPYLPPPNSPQAGVIVEPTDRYIDNLFKKEVYFTMSNLTSTSATITVYFVQQVVLERELNYESGDSVTKSATITSTSRTATISAAYKQTEEVTEVYGYGEKSFTYPSSDLLRYNVEYGDSTYDSILAWDIIDQYENGKELAKISCEIGEYDFIYKNDSSKEPQKIISQWSGSKSFALYDINVSVEKDSDSYNIIEVYLNYRTPVDLTIRVRLTNASGTNLYEETVTVFANNRHGAKKTNIAGNVYLEEAVYYSASYKFKKAFQIGDSVCPMVKNFDGSEKALSYYEDGTPKIFSVMASRILYDGAVLQELTLKEENKSNA